MKEDMKKVLIVSGHADTVSDSVVNRMVLDVVAEKLPAILQTV